MQAMECYSMSVNETLSILQSSETILRETKSRCSNNPATYRCIDEKGHIKGKGNPFRLTVPEILEIDRRIKNYESISSIAKDYPISSTSMRETMKKYYCHLLDHAIRQYYHYQWEE